MLLDAAFFYIASLFRKIYFMYLKNAILFLFLMKFNYCSEKNISIFKISDVIYIIYNIFSSLNKCITHICDKKKL